MNNKSLPHQAVLQPHRLIMLFEMCALLNGWMKMFLNLPNSGFRFITGFSLEFVCVSEH